MAHTEQMMINGVLTDVTVFDSAAQEIDDAVAKADGAVRFDLAQSLTEAQKGVARKNIGSASQADLDKTLNVVDVSTYIYVAKSGNDTTGNGSDTKPYQTIQMAINSLPRVISGSVYIKIQAGVYDESVSISDILCGNTLYLDGDSAGGTQVKCISIESVNSCVSIRNIELTGTSENNYNYSLRAHNTKTAILENVTCVNPVESAYVGALYFYFASTVTLRNCAISNKPVALDSVGSAVYLNDTVTGTDNTVGIRCGSGWGQAGGFVQKGGATIAGEEQKEYGGQIW